MNGASVNGCGGYIRPPAHYCAERAELLDDVEDPVEVGLDEDGFRTVGGHAVVGGLVDAPGDTTPRAGELVDDQLTKWIWFLL